MAKTIDKIVQQKTTPKDKNVLWDDGKNLKINRNGKWEDANKGRNSEGSNFDPKDLPCVTLYTNDRIDNLNEYFITDGYDFTFKQDVYVKCNDKIALIATEGLTTFTGDEPTATIDDYFFTFSVDEEQGTMSFISSDKVDCELIFALPNKYIPSDVLRENGDLYKILNYLQNPYVIKSYEDENLISDVVLTDLISDGDDLKRGVINFVVIEGDDGFIYPISYTDENTIYSKVGDFYFDGVDNAFYKR